MADSILALGAGALAFVTALVTLLVSIQNSRRIEQVHVIVNSRMTAVLERVGQLTAALEGSDTAVPIDPNPTT